MAYATDVYKFTSGLPVEERYNLMIQIRKAVVSVPLNIAEGAGATTGAEFSRFLGYAYRSAKEVVTCLELCQRLYPEVGASTRPALIDEGEQIARMTRALMQRLNTPH